MQATTAVSGTVGATYQSDYEDIVCPGKQRYIQGEPLALGAVQIMIGVVVLSFSMPLVLTGGTLGFWSGFFVWGTGAYITSGSLTVAAGKSFSHRRVKIVMGFNVVSSVAAFTAIILYSLDAAGLFTIFISDPDPFLSLIQAFSGVLVVFHFLEFVISITASILASRSTCKRIHH